MLFPNKTPAARMLTPLRRRTAGGGNASPSLHCSAYVKSSRSEEFSNT
jgi:hypothetical protein